MGKRVKGRGVDLLAGHNMVVTRVEPVVDDDLPPVPEPIRRAIIIEKCQGQPSKLIGLKYGVTPHQVSSIYKEFVAGTKAVVTAIHEQEGDEFVRTIRRKAIAAIDNGLECDRDPYRQGALGYKVMQGIGEFRPDQQSTQLTINNMVNSTPADWKTRYIGAGSTDDALKNKEDSHGRTQ